MLEVVASERRSKEPAGDVNELFERLLPYIDRVILVDVFDRDGSLWGRSSGKISYLNFRPSKNADRDYVEVHMGKIGDDGTAKKEYVFLEHRVSAVVDGVVQVIHAGDETPKS